MSPSADLQTTAVLFLHHMHQRNSLELEVEALRESLLKAEMALEHHREMEQSSHHLLGSAMAFYDTHVFHVQYGEDAYKLTYHPRGRWSGLLFGHDNVSVDTASLEVVHNSERGAA